MKGDTNLITPRSELARAKFDERSALIVDILFALSDSHKLLPVYTLVYMPASTNQNVFNRSLPHVCAPGLPI